MIGVNSMEIKLKDDFLLSSTTNIISTTFYIQHEDCCFPDNQWTDLTSSILEMWGEKLIRCKSISHEIFTLYFEDGPYRLDLQKDLEYLFVKCVNFRDNDCVEFSFKCSYNDFVDTFCKALKKFIYLLYTNDLQVDKYEPLYCQMKLILKHLKET